MASEGTITFEGQSGRKYTYWIYRKGTSFHASPANYVFTKETQAHMPIYIGETGDISERFDNHHKMPCIERNGATHICVHKSGDDGDVRRKEESNLVAKYKPVCND